jgi:hypothetical protein
LKSSFHWLLYFFLPTNISTYPNRKRIIIRQQNQSMYVGRPVYKIMNYEFIRGRCSIQKRLGKIFLKYFFGPSIFYDAATFLNWVLKMHRTWQL